jgi:hypothetical protein
VRCCGDGSSRAANSSLAAESWSARLLQRWRLSNPLIKPAGWPPIRSARCRKGRRRSSRVPARRTHSSGRWSDYSSIAVDLTDGCPFRYTQEYDPATSSAGWHTRLVQVASSGGAHRRHETRDGQVVFSNLPIDRLSLSTHSLVDVLKDGSVMAVTKLILTVRGAHARPAARSRRQPGIAERVLAWVGQPLMTLILPV